MATINARAAEKKFEGGGIEAMEGGNIGGGLTSEGRGMTDHPPPQRKTLQNGRHTKWEMIKTKNT